jgi:hypothetical protein
VASVIGGMFVLYYTTAGDILWAKTLFVNVLIWGGVIAVVAVIKALMRAGSSSSKPAPKPPAASPSRPSPDTDAATDTDTDADGPRLKTSTSFTDAAAPPPVVARTIAPVGGTAAVPGAAAPAAEPPKLRMSMGRQPVGAAVPAVGASRACPVCGTMVPTTSAACPACGRPNA